MPGYLVPIIEQTSDPGKYFAIRQKEGDDYGWRLDYRNKLEQAHTLKSLLQFGQPVIMEDFICPGCFDRPGVTDKQKRERFLGKLQEQMSRYATWVKETQDPKTERSVTISGKFGEDGKKKPGIYTDDGIVALCFAVWLAGKANMGYLPHQPRSLKRDRRRR